MVIAIVIAVVMIHHGGARSDAFAVELLGMSKVLAGPLSGSSVWSSESLNTWRGGGGGSDFGGGAKPRTWIRTHKQHD